MEDDRIIDLYWDRDQDAIAQTAQKYGSYCRSIAYGIVGNLEDAEECVSDTWLRAWDSIPPQRPGKLSAFLGRITRNLALDRYDYNHAAKRTAQFDQLLSELSECIPDMRNDYERMELTEILNQFLRSLTKDQRELFLRRYWQCRTVAQLAQDYQMSESAVKSALFRTRNKLKSHLEKEGITVE